MVRHPEWETTSHRDGFSDDEGPAVALLRVTIPSHVYDEAELDSALALLGDLANGAQR